MKIYEYLRKEKEEMPLWLKNYKVGDKITYKQLFSGRIVYYPGSGIDGEPIMMFNKGEYAHTFLYVDYLPTEEETRKELTTPGNIKGYHLLDIQNLKEKDLLPTSWTPHISLSKEDRLRIDNFVPKTKPYCLLAIYERDDEYNEEHGSKRFALCYLSADGIATYDALFANKGQAPDVLILQDHGFGGNYNYFGKGGYLHNIATRTNTYPKYIYCADNTKIWDGYKTLEGVEKGYKGISRALYKNDSDNHK